MPTIVVVEGDTDRLALTLAASRLGRDLAAEGVTITPIGGAHAIARVLAGLGREQAGARVAGLCDEGEEAIFGAALETAAEAGLLESLGFFVCRADLEDELIRAAGPETFAALAEREGDAAAWHTFQRQPAWRGQPVDQQFRRFIRSISDRNARYIRAILESLDPARIPTPLTLLLEASVGRGGGI